MINAKIPVGSTTTESDFVKKKGEMTELVWRPPLQYVVVKDGDTNFDDRGQFLRFRHVKVKFRNLLDVPVDIYVNTPMAKLKDDTHVLTRVKHMRVTLDPSGTKKELSRGKGKRKKSVSKRTDVYVHFFSASDVAKGDTNYDTILKTKVSARDSGASTDYNVEGWVLADYCVVVNDVSMHTGAALSANMNCVDVVFEVKYEVSALEGGENVSKGVKTEALYLFKGDAKLMFEFDTQPVIAFGDDLSVGGIPLLKQVPGYPAADCVGVIQEREQAGVNVASLVWCKGEQILGPFRWNAIETTSRLVWTGLEVGVAQGKWIGLEWKFDSDRGRWILVNNEGKPVNIEANLPGELVGRVSRKVPVVVYQLGGGAVDRSMQLTKQQALDVISTIIRVLQVASTVLAAL